jgi:hypothetical protein
MAAVREPADDCEADDGGRVPSAGSEGSCLRPPPVPELAVDSDDLSLSPNTPPPLADYNARIIYNTSQEAAFK